MKIKKKEKKTSKSEIKDKAEKKVVQKKEKKRESKKETQVKKEVKSKKSKSEKKEESTRTIEIWKHQLVPQHILLTPEEIQKLFEEYNITFDNLPKIKVHDPAIKHLNAKPGDVVKIIRKSKIAGECEYYRGVVE